MNCFVLQSGQAGRLFLRLLISLFWILSISYQATCQDQVKAEIEFCLDQTIASLAVYNGDSALFFAKKAYELSTENNLTEHRDKSLVIILRAFLELEQMDSVEAVVAHIDSVFNSETKLLTRRGYLFSKAIFLHKKGLFIQANQVYEEIYSIIQNKSGVEMAELMFNHGLTCGDLGNYQKSQELFIQALDTATKYQDLDLQQRILNSMGVIFKELKLFDKAIHCYKDGLTISRQLGDSVMTGDLYSNIAAVYDYKGEPKQSLFYNRKAKKIREQTKDYGLFYTIVLNNMGLNFIALNQLDSAEHYLKRTLSLCEAIEDTYGVADAHINLALLDIKRNQFGAAEEKIKAGYAIAHKINAKELLLGAHEELSKHYAEQSKYKEAFLYQTNYLQLKDSTLTVETFNKVNEWYVQYETLEKENQILKQTGQISEQKAALSRNRLIIALTTGVLLILTLVGIIFWNRRKARHQSQLELQKRTMLEEAFQKVEKEKNRISESLHGAVGGEIINLYYALEQTEKQNASQLLRIYEDIRKLSHQLDGKPKYGQLILDRLVDLLPEDSQKIALRVHPENLEIKEPVGTYVVRIIQELITNNLKYARANQTAIVINQTDDDLQINYSDDGNGTANFQPGNGHNNIAHIVTMVNGEIDINTQLNKGFQVQVNLPVK